MKKLYGYRNVAYYPGARAEGYAVWFADRKRRDRAIDWLRDKASRDGISEGAARAGIYPVIGSTKGLSEDQMDELASQGSVRTL